MTNLFLVLLSFLAHDVYKKIIFVYEYEAYKSDTGIHLFVPNLSWVILAAVSHDVTFAMNNQTAAMLASLPFL